MKFRCNKNKFLEQMLNMKPLKEEKFLYKKNYTGEIVELTNHYIVQNFLDTANKSGISEAQQILHAQKYSIKAINDFARYMGQNLIDGKMI